MKLADLRHNSDLTRLTKVTEKDIERKEKGLPIIKQFMDLTSIFKK